MTVQRHGVKYRKVQSRGGRWGGPKVHYAKWSPATRDWEPLCRFPWNESRRSYFLGAGYATVDDGEPATCKKCLSIRDRLL